MLEAIESSLAKASWSDLAKPLRVVVPSSTLRVHLAARFMEYRQRPALGVQFQTLHGLALELLHHSGETAPPGHLLFDCLVERMAREEPDLSQRLEGFVNGYQPVGATVRDLLDAGLEESLAAAAEEILESEGPALAPRETVRRALALIRVAIQTEKAMEILALGRGTGILRRATGLLENQEQSEPETLSPLPARQILIHGFADATGIAADLLEALMRYRGATVFFDVPPDPAAEAPDPELPPDIALHQSLEQTFSQRLLERLSLVAGAPPLSKLPSSGAWQDPSRLEVVHATGPEEEVDAVAQEISQNLAQGADPESFAVVMREPARYQHLLWRRFERLGIPFSANRGSGASGSFHPSGRTGRALLHLLQGNERTAVDRWLELLCLPARSIEHRDRLRMELRLAFHSLGAGRLVQVSALDFAPSLHKGSLVLPILRGLEGSEPASYVGEDESTEENRSGAGSLRAARRTLDGQELHRARAKAQSLQERLEAWPKEAPLEEHWHQLETLLKEDLGWPGEPSHGDILQALEEARRELPLALEVSRGELHRLLTAKLQEVEISPLGGQGAGVRLLSVTEARGLTFGHLFLLGLNRDSFPRPIREDPLLPDDLRKLLTGILPDIPIKTRGHSEERYLFAQLLSSSSRITLSWSEGDAEGRPTAPSPLLERLRWNRGDALSERMAQALFSPPMESDGTLLRPTEEVAILAGLYGSRDQFRSLASVAFEENRRELGFEDDRDHPRSTRLISVLDELDPDLSSSQGRKAARRLGPYLGWIGPTEAADPRNKALFVTQLEALAACPWQTFLQRMLRLQPTPDPLQALPEISPLLVGQLVHAAVDHIIGGPRNATSLRHLEEALRQPPQTPLWPAPKELDELLTTLAKQVLVEEGIHLAGFARPLVERARPYLEAAREALWNEPGEEIRTYGSELLGELRLGTNEKRDPLIFFRADLAESKDGGVRLTDLKTGKPIDGSKTHAARRKHFLKAVARGEKLQAVAYLLAAERTSKEGPEDSTGSGPGAERAQGRYLFLGPELEPEIRTFAVEPSDDDFKEAFFEASRKVLEAWDHGTFFPRLVDPKGEKEPTRCSYCAVAEACSRGDSGARRRLVEAADVLDQKRQSGEPLLPPEAAFLDAWRLPEASS